MKIVRNKLRKLHKRSCSKKIRIICDDSKIKELGSISGKPGGTVGCRKVPQVVC